MALFNVYEVKPIKIIKALGSKLWDEKNIEYLDLYGGHAVISLGHNHPYWVEKITKQLSKISFYSNSVILPYQEELAEKINFLSNKKEYQLFLCNSGAEANENALKLASFHNKRRGVVAFTKSFHGRTSLALAVTDNPLISAPINRHSEIYFLPFNDVTALEEFMHKKGNEIAAIIVEGIQGVGGIQVATYQFLQTIRNLCTKHESIFIADSVQCGCGRTGSFFSHDYAEMAADIYTMAKGLGNGFPVGAVLIAPFIKPKIGMLGTTFGGNPLACVAALAVLEVLEKENLLESAKLKGQGLMEQLNSLPELKNVRGRGLMIGFDLTENYKKIKDGLLWQHQLFVGEAKPNTIRLLPSLTISTEELALFFNRLKSQLNDLNNP